VGYRVLARITAVNNLHGLLEIFLANAGGETFDLIGAGSHNDVSDERTGSNATKTENDNGNAVEFEELLGSFRAHARAESCSRKNGNNMSHG
jgi:hypothetical protein